MTTFNDTSKRSQARFDWPLLVGVYALAVLGILCICMATFDIDVSDGQPLLNKILNSRSSMWQSIFFLVSPVIILVVMAIPTEFIRARVSLAYYIVLGLLMITLVAAGIKAIWNFAPVALKVPNGVLLKQENLALSLAYLNNQISK